jgi:hypothetical protein
VDCLRGLEPVHLRHAQVEHNQVWLFFFHVLESLLSVRGLAAHFNARLPRQQVHQPTPHYDVVVRD